jgi:hypothetical protein
MTTCSGALRSRDVERILWPFSATSNVSLMKENLLAEIAMSRFADSRATLHGRSKAEEDLPA